MSRERFNKKQVLSSQFNIVSNKQNLSSEFPENKGERGEKGRSR